MNNTKSLLSSFRYAFHGIIHAVKTERNLKIHLTITIFIIMFGIFFQLNAIEWCIIAFTIGGMISVELLNTAIERTVDLVTEDYHPLAKKAKDTAAGACFIFSIVSVVVGILIFLPKVVKLIQ